MAIGIDVGRKQVKACTTSGAMVTFPSVIGEFPEDDRLLLKRRDYMVDLNGQRRFLGEQAELESKGAHPIGAADKVHRDTLHAMLTVLGVLKMGGRQLICTAMPVDRYNTETKQALLQLVAGVHTVRVPFDGPALSVEIADVTLFPEGSGIYWSQILNAEGVAVQNTDLMRQTVRVFDLGSMTCNILTVRKGDPSGKESFTLPYGCYKLEGKRPLTPEAFADAVVDDVAVQLQNSLQEDDLILLGGGGAIPLAEAFQGRYKRVMVAQNPVEANAIGMARMGAGIERAQKQAGFVHGS